MGAEIKDTATSGLLEIIRKEPSRIDECLKRLGPMLIYDIKNKEPRCPVDTKKLSNSFEAKVENGELIVSSDISYAPIVHEIPTKHEPGEGNNFMTAKLINEKDRYIEALAVEHEKVLGD